MTQWQMCRRLLRDATFSSPFESDHMFLRVHLARAILLLVICLLWLTALFSFVVIEMFL